MYLYPFEGSHTGSPAQPPAFGLAGLRFCPLRCAMRARLAKKYAPGCPMALRLHFFARLGRFSARTCSSEPPRGGPGLDFRAQIRWFFEFFACDERSTRKTSDIEKTLAGAIRNALRSCRALTENVQKSIRKRCQLRWAMRRALMGVLGVAPKALGASPRRPEAAIGRLLAALDAPGEPQDWFWGGTWGSKSRPKRVCTRS